MGQATRGNEQIIYDSIKQAVRQRKLRPNTQLVEDVLAESFKVSRTLVRQALRRLAYEGLVKIIPYKGAFVACPGIEEAKHIMEIRGALEAAAVRQTCRNITEEQIQELEAMVEEEHKAHLVGDKFNSLELSLGFHLKIAEFTGNSYYYRYLEELTSLVNIIVTFYGSEKTFCGCDDHLELVSLIRQREEDLAAKFMIDHLQEVVAGINLQEDFSTTIEELFT